MYCSGGLSNENRKQGSAKERQAASFCSATAFQSCQETYAYTYFIMLNLELPFPVYNVVIRALSIQNQFLTSSAAFRPLSVS